MAIDALRILGNFKKPISVIRGRKYTFNLDTIDGDGNAHPFYFTTDSSGGANFPGVVTDGVSFASEIVDDPSLTGDDISILQMGKFGAYPNGLSYTKNLGVYNFSGAQAKGIALTLKNKVKIDEYYQITVATSFSAGNYQIFAGAAKTSSITSADSGTYSCILKATRESVSSTEDVSVQIVVDKDFVGTVSYLSVKQVAKTSGIVEFTPTYTTPDTIYYQCGLHADMGGQISVINAPGPVENEQEFYYTLGINQTNRTYPPIMKSDPKISLKFLTSGLPGGLFKNIFNLAPTGSLYADRAYNQYYDPPNGDNTVSLSGLISDPEDDTLKYRWYHYAPKTSLDGVNLVTTFSNEDKVDTTATIITPPTDMIYTLHLEVSDSDNVATIPINIKVSGTVDFENWSVGSGIQTFDLGDSTVPFEDLD